MNDKYEEDLETLRKKVDQQEITISQLVKIVAATNKKLSHLTDQNLRNQSTFNHLSS